MPKEQTTGKPTTRRYSPEEKAAYRAVSQSRWANRYNTRRRHSALGNISPNTYEAALSATLAEAA